LWEEINQRDLFDAVALGDQGIQIARQRCGIARDTDDFGRGNFREQRSGFGAQTGAGRVNHN